jgi:aminoglycoside 6'-N-acetyltransferase
MPNANEITIRGNAVALRPPTAADGDRLAGILAHPDVSTWWGIWDSDRVHREFMETDDGSVPLVIEVDDTVIGFIQFAEENDPDYRHASIDIFLDPIWHGKGLGADAIRALANHLFTVRGHHRITIDPAAHNVRAIRSYQRVGFRPVGIMRKYERASDGAWHDGLLMDLLREDLTEA